MPVAAADRAGSALETADEPWWARLDNGSSSSLVAVRSPEFPPGTVVDLPGERRPSGWQVAVVSADGRQVAVDVALPGAPLLWYVELPEPAATPRATGCSWSTTLTFGPSLG